MDIQNIPFFNVIKTLSENLNTNIYFVGGTPRDLLLHREIKDIDIIILGSSFEIFASKLAKIIKAHRVIFKDNIRLIKSHLIIDISRPKGLNIIEDLAKRDITINSLAINLSGELIGNTCDIFNKIIKMNYPFAFIDDPLRILRVFRFASELGFSIDLYTYNKIKETSHLIKNVASERIFEELYKTFSGHYINEIFPLIIESKLFSEIFDIPEYVIYRDDIANIINVLISTALLKKRSPEEIFILSLSIINIIVCTSDKEIINRVKKGLKKVVISKNIYEKIIYYIETCIKLLLEYRKNNENLEPFVFNNYCNIDNLIFILNIFEHSNKKFIKNNRHLIDDILEIKNNLNMQKAEEINGRDLLNAGFKEGPELGKYLFEARFKLASGKISSKEDAITYLIKYLR